MTPQTIIYITEMECDETIVCFRFDSDEYHIYADDGYVKLFYKDVLKYEWIAENEMCSIEIEFSSLKKYETYSQYYEDDEWTNGSWSNDNNIEYIKRQYDCIKEQENSFHSTLISQEC